MEQNNIGNQNIVSNQQHKHSWKLIAWLGIVIALISLAMLFLNTTQLNSIKSQAAVLSSMETRVPTPTPPSPAYVIYSGDGINCWVVVSNGDGTAEVYEGDMAGGNGDGCVYADHTFYRISQDPPTTTVNVFSSPVNTIQISLIQDILAGQGVLLRGYKAGELDANTVKAITSLQEKNGLKKSGTLDAGTLSKLNQLAISKMRVAKENVVTQKPVSSSINNTINTIISNITSAKKSTSAPVSTVDSCSTAYTSCMNNSAWYQGATATMTTAFQDGCKVSYGSCLTANKSTTQQIPVGKRQQISCRQAGWPNLTTNVYVTIDPPLPIGSFNANDANGKLTAVCTVGPVMN